MTRTEVYHAIEKEQVYQESEFGILRDLRTIEEFLIAISNRAIVAEGMKDVREPLATITQIKKIAALSASFLERYGK